MDVWQADENGFCDVQVTDEQPLGNGRGLFTTDEYGRFWFRTVVPAHYPIPMDGPVGELLTATGRHPAGLRISISSRGEGQRTGEHARFRSR